MQQVRSELRAVETGGKAEVYVVPNFLSEMECQYLINVIDRDNIRSTVVDSNKEGRSESESRTSSSAFLSLDDGMIALLNKKMHDYLPENLPLELGEDPQGQKYEPGQFFNDHTDYFDVNDPTSYAMHAGSTGQRNWTFMIYLNDVEEGGETDFPELGLKFYPERGKAVIWRNLLPDGQGNRNTMHAGRPPIKGTKYVITKWFREGVRTAEPSNVPMDPPSAPPITTEKFEIRPLNARQHTSGVFTDWQNIPRFTEKGFKVVQVPEKAWAVISDAYQILKDRIREENYPGMEDQIYIKAQGPGSKAADVIPLWEFPSIINVIHEYLFETHQEWAQTELEPSFIYGIRSYRDGAYLFPHRDRIATHHISSIILVDQDIREPWGLDIQDHDGNWHKVYINPGEMILYESAACDHARTDAFQGEYFRNFFCHYKLKNYKYVGEE